MFTPLLSRKGLAVALALTATLGAAQKAHAQTIDGTRDASYPAALALQTNATGFSDNNVGSTGVANGDELDNIHAQIVGANLYLFVGGNFQTNNNHCEIFFDSKSGGLNKLVASANITKNAQDTLSGLKFDTGFNADYYISVSAKQNPAVGTAPATFNSVNVFYGVVGSTTGSYIGKSTTATTAGTITFGTNSTGAVALNNSNIGGVTGTTVGTPSTVATGLELMIPLAAIGSSAGGGDFKISIFINGAKHDYVSNQALGGFASGTGNLGGDGKGTYIGGATMMPSTPVSGVDFSTFAGNQYVTVTNGGPLATTAAAGRAQITVAPNPAQGRFQVQLPATTEATSLALYNSLGQAVRQLSAAAGATSAAVETSGLATGVYVLRVQAGTETLATQRVVVQ